jgi:hypothetical protein
MSRGGGRHIWDITKPQLIEASYVSLHVVCTVLRCIVQDSDLIQVVQRRLDGIRGSCLFRKTFRTRSVQTNILDASLQLL